MLAGMDWKFFARDCKTTVPTKVGEKVVVENFFGGDATVEVTGLWGDCFMAKLVV